MSLRLVAISLAQASEHVAAWHRHNRPVPAAKFSALEQLQHRQIAALEDELKKLRRTASVFGRRVLDGDRYGCENGPSACLHMDAKRFLDKIEVAA